METADLLTALPELFLAVVASALLMLGVFRGRGSLGLVLAFYGGYQMLMEVIRPDKDVKE